MQISRREGQELSDMIYTARKRKGLTKPELAELAYEVSPPDVVVTTEKIRALERIPVRPLHDELGRVILSAVATVLNLDMDRVNRLSGGVYRRP